MYLLRKQTHLFVFMLENRGCKRASSPAKRSIPDHAKISTPPRPPHSIPSETNSTHHNFNSKSPKWSRHSPSSPSPLPPASHRTPPQNLATLPIANPLSPTPPLPFRSPRPPLHLSRIPAHPPRNFLLNIHAYSVSPLHPSNLPLLQPEARLYVIHR